MIRKLIKFTISLKLCFIAFFFALAVYPLYATTPTAARIPMMATTTKSSIRVKAFLFDCVMSVSKLIKVCLILILFENF